VSPGFGGCASAGGSRQRVRSLEIRGTPDIGRRARCKTAMGVIRFQHRRKISPILIRNTVVPIAIRTTSGRCLAIRQITENPELL
jgi:hypothetical protein